MKNTKKAAMAFGVAAMAAMMSFTAPAAEKIEGITLEIDSSIYAGESGSEVEVILDDDNCYVDTVTVTNEPDVWEEDDKPKLKVVILANDGYAFMSGFGKDEVALDEDSGKVTSVSRSASRITVNITLTELYYSDDYDDDYYDLDVYDLGWDGAGSGYAYWEGTDYAKRYEVRLYRDGEEASKVLSTEDTTYDFSSYFTKGGDYSFKARAVRNSNNTSSWSTSDEWEVSDSEAAEIRKNAKTTVSSGAQKPAGSTDGAWLKDSVGYWWCNPDKTYPAAKWKAINGEWYYFNAAGYCVMNEWVQTDGLWYYCGPSGAMAYGWVETNGKWYFCGSTGAMLVNSMTPDHHYVGGDGVWIN